MEGNKDDALKCLRIGKDALESGDRARALKFINKARRLDPTIPVDDILSKIEGESDKQPRENQAASAAEDQPSIRQRVRPAGATLSSSSSVTYTEEQITIVRQLKKKKDYYEILGLEKGCGDEEVKKAYRKLSLKVHPDKNKAPGAEEAFKSVSRAFQCLSNEESRKKYDVTGSDEPVLQRRAPRGGYSQGFGGGFYEADFDPDEIFRNFFGGMHPATTQYRTYSFGTGTGQRNGENGSGGSNLRMLIQLLPVLLILLMSFMPSHEPMYSLSRSYPYEHKFTTHRGVNYYVKSQSFDQEYPPNSQERSVFEGSIEREYASVLHHNCRLEMQRRQWGYVVETPHCDMFRQFQAAA